MGQRCGKFHLQAEELGPQETVLICRRGPFPGWQSYELKEA
jgi:hypothetical protein